jgi:hypothetical protein
MFNHLSSKRNENFLLVGKKFLRDGSPLAIPVSFGPKKTLAETRRIFAACQRLGLSSSLRTPRTWKLFSQKLFSF